MNISIGELAKLSNIELPSTSSESNTGDTFSSFFEAAMSNFNETNELQNSAESLSVDFALGKIDSIQDVMIAQEKASVALQYTVSLRDAILDAYNEIMQMQL
jgi:flagellar hook-basal body complex protein FliE